MSLKIPDLEFNYDLMKTIKKRGKDLCSLSLLIACETGFMVDTSVWIDDVIEGCPKLKNLTVESLIGWKDQGPFKASFLKHFTDVLAPESKIKDVLKDADFSDMWRLSIRKESFEALSKRCKELKDLKITKISFEDIFTEDDIKKILPDCNVEIKECSFEKPDEDESDDSSDKDDSGDSSDSDDE